MLSLEWVTVMLFAAKESQIVKKKIFFFLKVSKQVFHLSAEKVLYCYILTGKPK